MRSLVPALTAGRACVLRGVRGESRQVLVRSAVFLPRLGPWCLRGAPPRRNNAIPASLASSRPDALQQSASRAGVPAAPLGLARCRVKVLKAWNAPQMSSAARMRAAPTAPGRASRVSQLAESCEAGEDNDFQFAGVS